VGDRCPGLHDRTSRPTRWQGRGRHWPTSATTMFASRMATAPRGWLEHTPVWRHRRGGWRAAGSRVPEAQL